MKARRETDINSMVASFGNPMSKRAMEFTMRMDDSLDAIVSAFTVDGTVIQADAANIVQINNSIKLALQRPN